MSRIVPAPDALVGKRFDVAVAKMLGISRSKAADLVDSGQARVLGREVARSSTLQAGETVEFDLAEEQAEPEPIATDMAVVYEDDDVVVVDKPVGVAAHASVGWTGPTVLGSLRDRGVHITSYGAAGREGIVSRLDVGTSGLMLVCKSDLAYTEMRRQFAEHEVKKTYHALVQGNLKENKATIEAPIGRAKVSDFRFCVTPAGKEAITHWDVMERFGEATLVSVNLETGRTHQIRVHFSYIGHGLVGDPVYMNRVRVPAGASQLLADTLRGFKRQALHAAKLGLDLFDHRRCAARHDGDARAVSKMVDLGHGQAVGHGPGMQRPVPDIGHVAGEQRPCLAPVGPVIVQHLAGALGLREARTIAPGGIVVHAKWRIRHK